MTSDRRPPGSSDPLLIWDTSPLLHAIKAGKIEIPGDIAQSRRGGARRNVTTQAVISEIDCFRLPLAGKEWLSIVHVDDLHEINALVEWMNRVSGAKSNHGEATVLAWAEVHDAVAIVDDADARRIGRAAGLDVRGSLRVIAESVGDGHITRYASTALVDAMIDTGARYPCARGQFVGWAERNGLL
ncbi:hypothetical protein [Streptomyces sp. RFCAC02]|uniref:hypothetical protein n=1 Tax=Streptomyces sp. RFCAC02 TaxID=2499143 RepID=UPI00101F8004|nr:hypothetical protein [Streptomyces sp. RFCAC02]